MFFNLRVVQKGEQVKLYYRLSSDDKILSLLKCDVHALL